ncbi:MAG: hypothetical protein ABIO39_11310 [Caulobacteraceae bacterium]
MDDLQERLTAFKAAIVSGCEDHWIFLVPSSLGEVAAVCALSAAFKERHGGKICIVADQSRADLAQLFSGCVDVMKFADIHSMRALSSHGALEPLKFEIGYPQNIWVNQNRCGRSLTLHDLFINEPERGGLSFMDLMRYALNLPWDAAITKASLGPEVQASALQFALAQGVEPSNSVVLFPGNNTNKPAPAEFWNTLAAVYTKAGKKVFYCVHGAYFKPEDLNIHGVQLNMTPGLAVAVCEIAGHMVSGANGLVALSLLTESTFDMDVILTDGHDVVGNFIFTPMDPQHSSTFRCMPELVNDISRPYREWVLKGDGDFAGIANDIVRAG